MKQPAFPGAALAALVVTTAIPAAAWAAQPVAVVEAAADVEPVDPPVDVQAVARDVRAALDRAPDVPDRQIIVTTHARTLVLAGQVASGKEKLAAEAAAESAAQGLRITSQLEVQPPEGGALLLEDARLVRGVEQALDRDPRTANLGVAVSISRSNVIGLHGLVPTDEGRAAAYEVASKVQGVHSVDNRLLIPGEE